MTDFLSHRAAATPDRTALVDSATGRVWTFRELDERVDQIAAHLREAHSVDADTSVGTLLSARPAFVVTFYATIRLGGTVVGLHTALSEPELAAHCQRTRPDLLVCERETESLAASVDCPVLSVDGSEWHTESATESEASVPPAQLDGRAVTPVPLDDDETVLVLFTSGTTGEPKGVRLTLGNLAASATASAFRLGVSPGDQWLCCLPVSHMGGLSPVVRTVRYGTTLVCQRAFDAAATRRVIDDHGVTGVSLVPTQLERLLADSAGDALATLETVLLGGAPAPESLVERADEAGVPVYPTYGLTETASQVATALPEQAREHPDTVGQPLVDTTVRIVADGEQLAAGERGEIVVDGPTVTPGYLGGTREAFGEWGLHTGDVGYRDEDGRLWVVGRRDDLVMTGGELVAPRAVTDAICSHPDIADAAVVGLADPEWGERVAALVVSTSAGLSGEDVREYCRDRLASYKLPKTVAFVEELPRTPSGTVDRGAVRERLRE